MNASLGLRAFVAYVAILSVAPATRAQDDVPPLDITNFGFERQRKDISGATNKVTVTLTIKAGDTPVTDLRAKIDYKDVYGKTIADAGPTRVGDLDPQQTKTVAIAGVFIPLFNGYLITFTGRVGSRRGEWSFFGASGIDRPSYLPSKPVANTAHLVVISSDLEQNLKKRGAVLYVRVRNLGALQATDAACFLEVRGKDGKQIGKRLRAPLTGAKGGRPKVVDGGEERLFAIRFSKFQGIDSFSVELDWKTPGAEKALGGGAFAGAAEVELGHFKFERPTKEELVITGKARNGLATSVSNVRVIVRLLQKPKELAGRATVVKTIEGLARGPIAPNEIAPFSIPVPGAPQFDDFEYEVAYEEAGSNVGQKQQAGQVLVRVQEAVRKPDNSVHIKGEIENTSSLPLKNVEVDFVFRESIDKGGDIVDMVTYALSGILASRTPVTFEVIAKDCQPFDEYYYEIRFAPVNGANGK
jgi:hypothetical protein